MKKRINQPDRAAKPNQIITVNQLIFIAEPRELNHHTEHTSYPGKPKNIRKVFKQQIGNELGHGKYVGDQGKITAFVWLDEEPVSIDKP